MLCGEIVEGQQFLTILDQTFRSLWVFRLEGVDEQIEGGMGVLAGLGLPNIMQHLPGLGPGTLGQVNAHVPGLMHPAPLLARVWKDLLQCRPETHSPVAGGQFGRVPSARFPVLRPHLRHFYRDRPDPGLHGPFRVIPAADNRRAAVRCTALGKLRQKGIALGLNRRLKKLAGTFAQKVGQRIGDCVSTGEINDGSVVHGGASSNGWWFVLQLQTNQMHRRHSNRPNTRFTHSSHANELAFGANGSDLCKGGFADEIMAFQIDQTTKAHFIGVGAMRLRRISAP